MLDRTGSHLERFITTGIDAQTRLEERDVSRLLEFVARRLRELIRARRVLISVPTLSGGLRVVAAHGEGVADLIGDTIPSESKGARVLTRGKSERIDSLLEDPEVDQVSARGRPLTVEIPLS